MNIFESLENLNVSEECFDDIIGIVEEYINELKAPNKETAQAVVDRKVNQLKDSSAKMGAARDTFKNNMTFDGAAMNGFGTTPHTAHSSSDHSKTIQDASQLNQGAFRIAKAAKKYGADNSNLKAAGQGHYNDILKNKQDHHNIKHMHD